MQNRYCSAGDAGYVELNSGWSCRRCGCANQGCDVCRQCGWNRCGCQGGVWATQTRETRCACQARPASASDCGCEAQQSRQDACGCASTARQTAAEACPPDRTVGHSVQCCPANTALRSTAVPANATGCGCSNAAVPANATGCGCSNAAAPVNAGCGCNNAAVPANATGCGCNNAAVPANAGGCQQAVYSGRAAECPTASGVGMVYAVDQALGEDVYQSESALRTGTLFPSLHKPMNGRCPAGSNCSSTGQQSAFAAWDLRLYLDTHPDDAQALSLFGQLAREAEDPNYATAFLSGGSTWTWTDEPWPWECRPCNAQ